MTFIRNARELSAALDRLCVVDPAMAALVERHSPVPLRSRPSGFAGLAEIIIGQQVSKASAAAMNARLVEACGVVTPEHFLAIGEEGWIAIGLSRAKQKTLALLARKIGAGQLDLEALALLSPEVAAARLKALHGIGPWTAEVYLMFCIGHGDIFPAGDIALQTAILENFGTDCRKNAALAAAFAERWQPVRGAAARVLWADYANRRSQGELPV